MDKIIEDIYLPIVCAEYIEVEPNVQPHVTDVDLAKQQKTNSEYAIFCF